MAKRIESLIAGGNEFVSRGMTTVKVTRDGKKEFLQLPIISRGVVDYMQELKMKMPKPPTVFERVADGSPLAETFGLQPGAMVRILDLADEAYQNQMETYNQDFNLRIVIASLDIEWSNDGRTVETFTEKKQILKDNGITSAHINSILDDIRRLTEYDREHSDFLLES